MKTGNLGKALRGLNVGVDAKKSDPEVPISQKRGDKF